MDGGMVWWVSWYKKRRCWMNIPRTLTRLYIKDEVGDGGMSTGTKNCWDGHGKRSGRPKMPGAHPWANGDGRRHRHCPKGGRLLRWKLWMNPPKYGNFHGTIEVWNSKPLQFELANFHTPFISADLCSMTYQFPGLSLSSHHSMAGKLSGSMVFRTLSSWSGGQSRSDSSSRTFSF